MKNMIRDKNGEVPVVILVIGILAICALTIFSFYSSSESFRNGFASVNVVQDAGIIVKKINFYQEVGISEEDLVLLFGIKSDTVGEYVLLEREGISVKRYLP